MGSIEVRSAPEVWRTLGTESLALLNLNCEGCEYDVLPTFANAGLLSHVERLLFQGHMVLTEDEAAQTCDFETGTCSQDAYKRCAERYCKLEGTLSQTHRRVFGLPFHAFEL